MPFLCTKRLYMEHLKPHPWNAVCHCAMMAPGVDLGGWGSSKGVTASQSLGSMGQVLQRWRRVAQAFKVILSYTGQLGPQETRAKWSGSREASQLRTQLTANLPIAISTLLARELSQSKFNCQGFRVRLLRGYPTNLTGFFTG